jgi:hypothetical protein
MKAKVTDGFGDVLYRGPLPATGPRTGTHPQADRALMRDASQRAEIRHALAHHEALRILRAAEQPAPYLRDDLQAVRRRAWDAPMATGGRTEYPAAYRPPVDRVDATLGALMAAASLALVAGGVVLAMWLQD